MTYYLSFGFIDMSLLDVFIPLFLMYIEALFDPLIGLFLIPSLPTRQQPPRRSFKGLLYFSL